MSRTGGVFLQNGAFIPRQSCDLPEGSEVEFTVERELSCDPVVTAPVNRAALLKDLVRRMRENPSAEHAPRFTRDQLHELR